ncbi:MAG: hypothetical protein IT330_11750 [Anaerolineae bacterium]|nr:hypothetical protein [Anaerolineae bacterium]
MTPPPQSLLPDADVIIYAHKIKVWSVLKEKVRIVVPSVILHKEAIYSETDAEWTQIDLPGQVARGEIAEIGATTKEINEVLSKFDVVAREALHIGELEALALLLSGRAAGALFCSADKAAIQSLALLGLSEQGVSLEGVLRSVGLSRPLQHQYTESYFRRHIGIGKERRIKGEGLANKRLW